MAGNDHDGRFLVLATRGIRHIHRLFVKDVGRNLQKRDQVFSAEAWPKRLWVIPYTLRLPLIRLRPRTAHQGGPLSLAQAACGAERLDGLLVVDESNARLVVAAGAIRPPWQLFQRSYRPMPVRWRSWPE